jgi:bifunctional non-homologous end joining protein LigD
MARETWRKRSAGIEWSFVIETALALRELIRSEGLNPWPKVTGGKGLHLMVPPPSHTLVARVSLMAASLARIAPGMNLK